MVDATCKCGLYKKIIIVKMPKEWKTKALNELLPSVKKLGGGLKTKSICSSLLKRGEKKVIEMISTPEILKSEFLLAKRGPVRVSKHYSSGHGLVRGGCRCVGRLHTNTYFCDDNWRQREEDDWERGRDKD